MPTPTPPTATAPKPLTPEGLANQMFDGAFAQNPKDPRAVAGQVIGFLSDALFYAVKSSKTDPIVFLTELLLSAVAASKNDPIVFLTETLVHVVASSSGDDASRVEMLTHISNVLAYAAQQAPKPAPAAPPLPGKP